MAINNVLSIGESRALRALDFPPPGCEGEGEDDELEENNAC